MQRMVRQRQIQQGSPQVSGTDGGRFGHSDTGIELHGLELASNHKGVNVYDVQ